VLARKTTMEPRASMRCTGLLMMISHMGPIELTATLMVRTRRWNWTSGLSMGEGADEVDSSRVKDAERTEDAGMGRAERATEAR
jgi:hypothetical protein